MIALITTILMAFTWLALETNWLTVRLLMGDYHKPIVKPRFEPMLCRHSGCGKCSHKDRWLSYRISAKTIHLYGSTLNFYEGCNWKRSQIIKAIHRLQKQQVKQPKINYSHNKLGGLKFNPMIPKAI